MIIVNREQMYQIEQTAMKHGITAELMMEQAGKCSAEWINSRFSADYKVIIICGHGNNGGDGFVIARYLHKFGYQIKILFLGDVEKMSPETKSNYMKCQNLSIVTSTSVTSKIFVLNDNSTYIVIDARFGIGFRGSLPDDCDFIFHIMDVLKDTFPVKISIDIPSGINANTGELEEQYTFKADYTLTCGFPKIGLFYKNAPNYTGKIEIVDIGITSQTIIDEALNYNRDKLITYIEDDDIRFPARFKASQKGCYGKVGIIAGSPGYTGAAILACRAALACGAGLITLFHQPGLEVIFETTLIEVMTKVIDNESVTNFKNTQKDDTEINVELSNLLRSDVILIGPGLGKSDWSHDILSLIINHFKNKPMIIDADGINILAANPKLLNKIKKNNNVYLTPHMAEFSRLINTPVDEIIEDPFKYLDDFTKGSKINILLKNHYCICKMYNDDSYKTYFISGGNDGLSKGGSGDVLAGMLVSFIAQIVNNESAMTIEPSTHAQLSNLHLSNWMYSPVKYFYSLAEKLEEKFSTPAITPSHIIESIFNKETK